MRGTFLLLLALVACGPTTGPARLGEHAVTARLGAYDSGSRRGLSLLVTARDAQGRGPSTPWTLTLRSPHGDELATGIYDDSSTGSFVAYWWESVPAEFGTYSLDLTSARGQMMLPLLFWTAPGLSPPSPVFDGPSSTVTWPPVSGAGAYACTISRGAAPVTATAPAADTHCDVGGLEDGSYLASVRAFAVDLVALAADPRPEPPLPASFDIAESQLGFAKGGSGVQLRAAGGELRYGPVTGGLAVWLSLAGLDGLPPASSVPLTIQGPGLPASGLTASYPAGASQHLVLAYEARPRTGSYVLSATVGPSPLATAFNIGSTLKQLTIPQDIMVTALGGGTADVTWSPVTGALSYRISTWVRGASSPTAIQFETGTSTRFPSGTFQAGQQYDVYVTAADVDMTSPPLSAPASVAASENSYFPASFTAP